MKQAYLYITPSLFVEFTKASQQHEGKPRRFLVIENPLPDDAEVVKVESLFGNIRLLIESQSFNDVDAGSIPDLPPPIYRTVFDGE